MYSVKCARNDFIAQANHHEIGLGNFNPVRRFGGKDSTADLIRGCSGVEVRGRLIAAPPWLAHEVDRGEAAVIQTALAEGIPTVILDDHKARRAARLAGLEVTGSLGLLVFTKRVGRIRSVREATERMKAAGAWLDEAVIQQALRLAGRSRVGPAAHLPGRPFPGN